MLSLGGRVWVIDVGRSYQKLATALGGAFLAFTPDAGLCLNPFPLVGEHEEEADLLAGLLMAMVAPSGHLSDLQAAELKRLLRNVWDAHHQATTIEAVAAALLGEADQRVRDLGRQLYPFTTAGEYGRFFNGPNTVDLDRPFVVLELEELKGRKHLQQVVLAGLSDPAGHVPPPPGARPAQAGADRRGLGTAGPGRYSPVHRVRLPPVPQIPGFRRGRHPVAERSVSNSRSNGTSR
jgi:hypothetical protein